jgi:hypothetical protein
MAWTKRYISWSLTYGIDLLVEVVPQNLTVVGVVVTSEGLLGTVVNNGDSNRSELESCEGFELGQLGGSLNFRRVLEESFGDGTIKIRPDASTEESRVIVVVVEVSEVLEVVCAHDSGPVVVEILDVSHVFGVQEYFSDREELRVVEHGVNGSMMD